LNQTEFDAIVKYLSPGINIKLSCNIDFFLFIELVSQSNLINSMNYLIVAVI